MVSPTEAISPVSTTVANEENASTNEGKAKGSSTTAAVVVSAWILNNVLRAVMGLVADEFKMVFSRDGIKINAVDPAHVFMGVQELDRKAFDKYEISEPFEVGVDKDKLKEMLDGAKMTKKNPDLVTMVFDMEKMILSLSFGLNKEQTHLIDASGMSDLKIPSLVLKSEFKARIKEIYQWMTKKATRVSDHVKISTEDGKIVFSAEGDTDKSVLELPADSPLVKYILGEKTTTLFSLEYITRMFKALDGAVEFATFYNSTNYPLKVEYEYSDGNAKGIFLLAPRLENGG